MTDAQIKRQVEIIESVRKEVCSSPEAADKFLKAIGFFGWEKERKLKKKING